MKKNLIYIFVLVCTCAVSEGQSIKVNPTGVNVNSQNPTVVFLTFGRIPTGYVPAEALWCGQIVPATAPALGSQCRPDTIYGTLPARYDLSQASGNLGLTDIMSIPASVARRAYQTALEGGGAGFFYVRRFVSNIGQPDQYVNVTCRMSGGGARVPFALTNVEIRTGSNEPVLFVGPNENFANLSAEIQYNGTGRLKGRWELVRPGEEPPADADLLTEGSLPLEARGKQKRFLQIARFNHFLPPGGKFSLPLEVNGRLPIEAEGQYLLLLRIEAVDDKESDSDLRVIGVGDTVVHSGAVAGFSMPTLKFFVSAKPAALKWETDSLLSPTNDFVVDNDQPVVFQWRPLTNASIYKLEVFDDRNVSVLSAYLVSPVTSYQSPSWLRTRFTGRKLKWHIAGLDGNARIMSVSRPREIQFK
jgi:hypothetical protein